MNIIERANLPTPKFFKTLRAVGVILLAVSGSVMAAPIALPAVVVTVAGYLAVAGGVMSAVSQVTVDNVSVIPGDKIIPNEEAMKNADGFSAKAGNET